MKWITITPDGMSKSGKTRQWVVRSKAPDLEIGAVRWYSAWRKYIFAPGVCTIYEERCLTDIAEFVAQATREHYENLKAKPKETISGA